MKLKLNPLSNLTLLQILVCIKQRQIYRSFFIWTFVGLIGCNSDSNLEVIPLEFRIEKKVFLKELTTGININELKNIKYKKVNTNIYVFDYNYYGGVRNVQAEVNQLGEIQTLKFSLNENFESLKSSIQDKLEEENGSKVRFACSSETVTPNIVTIMHFKNCIVMSDSQTLLLTEIDRERTESLLPRRTVNLELKNRN